MQASRREVAARGLSLLNIIWHIETADLPERAGITPGITLCCRQGGYSEPEDPELHSGVVCVCGPRQVGGENMVYPAGDCEGRTWNI